VNTFKEETSHKGQWYDAFSFGIR